ncbi:MAG: hypothetical protein A3B10_02760 [Candidatus Doudnabacteria bacterium RIFCSPLOWO2_01_FULL_44_21]|uniref:Ribbon-helix-helix protein CopG domain-containing protein n=1 Tax=Candidatus Doudnabacteria bacterium RIFCSPLOWO2_01_FULL_44_21 TaxID=1817841 RepID=A0A1F5Q254_9BACT|nr:MAG: hypothetical protein A3B95_03030 [Candidatus Doudnabacteria bacterium RIFCSPHIGHO2_02_FULL_43_13b]OGE96208.1 MAG: hypothetical protein A3B10_02760 [Candidatus Doudnabacteria bacterium RIFCSPLOWO2_01_FULL_44_21]
MPQVLKKEVEEAVKKGGYATKSEFVRDLMRLWKEEQLLQELRESQTQIARGRGKVLRSLKDLR